MGSMIKQDSIEALKARLDIVEVIGSYIELKRAGSTYKGCCPFHEERTPSFNVNPQKGFYHCFGCKAGGDVIRFVQEHERLGFNEAVEKLAREYNFALEFEQGSHAPKPKNTALVALNRLFVDTLGHHPEAAAYLRDRGISDAMIERFEIGYAPESRTQLARLSQEKIPLPMAIEAGGFSEGEGGRPYPRFIDRVTFPIHNPQGVLVGFGGRTLGNHPAKYVNSAQSALFNKSRLLYAYHLARDRVLKTKRLIVAEGYLDVVMLHQAGFGEAVASLGTALTEGHLPLIKRLDNPAVILAYDGDSAGITAAYKAATLLSAHGFKGGVVLFEEGLDPADMVKNGQIEALKALFEGAKPFAHFVIDRLIEEAMGEYGGPEGREQARKRVGAYLNTLGALSAEGFAHYAASQLGTDVRYLKPRSQGRLAPSNSSRAEGDLTELSVIKTLLLEPGLSEGLIDYLDIGLFERHAQLFALIGSDPNEHGELRELLSDDRILPLSEEELRQKIRHLSIALLRRQMRRIRTMPGDFTTKSFRLRKLQSALTQLERGRLLLWGSWD